jgi:hypothetical protein
MNGIPDGDRRADSRKILLRQVGRVGALFLAVLLGGCAAHDGQRLEPASPTEQRQDNTRPAGEAAADAAGSAAADVAGGAAADAESDICRHEYLIFAIQNMPLRKAREALAEIKEFYGPNRTGSSRLYGFSLWSLMLFKQSTDEMAAILDQAFDMADEFDLPVYLHLDMLHNPPTPDAWRGPDIKFYEDPMMCEWTAFPGPGEQHGPVPHYFCNWGRWFSAPAFPCFASPRLRDFVTTQLRLGVLEPLGKRLADLEAKNRRHLFAGICVGWETHIPDQRAGQPYPFPSIDPTDPPVDTFSNPAVTMEAWEMGRLGYAALHHLGYDQARLEKEAAVQGKTVDTLFIDLCHQVNHDYTELLARTVNDSGVPRRKIYSHTLALSTTIENRSTFSPPVRAAVNPCCTPAFTLDKFGAAIYDLARLKQDIRDADPGQNRFGIAETYFRKGCTEEQFTGFLKEMFDNGASLMHILAWHSGQNPESPFYVPKKMAGPHLSVRNWLREGVSAIGTGSKSRAP